MAEQNRGGARGRRGRGRGRGGVPAVDEPVRERDLRDVEVDDMRARIQELERLLAATGVNAQGEDEEFEDYSDDEEGENPFGVPDHGRNRRARHGGDTQPFQNFGMKIEVPEFEGRAQPDEFIDWLHTVERFFDLREPTEVQKVKLVALKLRRHASIWWEHVKKQRAREGKSKVETWDKMKKLLQKKFLPDHYRQEAWVQYHGIKQGSLSVELYTAEFDNLRMRCDAVEEDEQTIARYLQGLKPEISDVVYLQQWWTYDDVCRLALKVEGQLKRKSTGARFQNRFPTAKDSGDKVASKTGGSTSKDAVSKPVSKEAGNSSTRIIGKRCFKC